ncbi:carboxymuconolactone decarboxylase family protein [Paralcaligenes sp. KSB-10]|uniref:carboxymuconolactone decarboxylase family protein n=1 Tax=Paralcaligenes sp. KSB-10 TaxID=2901142 RepID=UPI001E5DD913|nr:carboxymuconolactone decarboxylase family protein [Paralcaligenes sp. KSB-10]UHL63776.1 carboxymuconolactone decarboxylase family protein [Paralcaligenes sp. KSB-10]
MTSPRFAQIEPENMTEPQRKVAAEIASGPRGSIRGPFLALIHQPELASRVQSLGEYLRFGTQLAPDLIELAVLVAARRWSCQYEWHAHSRIARETTTLSTAIIEAIARGEPPVGMSGDQAAVYLFCRSLHQSGEADDATFNDIAGRFGLPGALDLIALCGYYSMLAMVLNTARLPLPAGVAAPLMPLDAKGTAQ